MALSANSIIHYTAKLEYLLNIIRSNGLRFSYCSEKIKTRGGKSFSAAIAMVSFCDIPLSDYKKHFYNKKNTGDLGYYGDYGIGLSKKWASKNGLNPVFYVEYNSHISTSLRKDFERFVDNNQQVDVTTPHQLFLYSKNHEGELYRDGIRKSQYYRFYDEREWRIVPETKQLNNKPVVINDKAYQSNKTKYKQSIEDSLLKFTLQDISYIIVKTTKEIPQIYAELKSAFNIKGDIVNLTSITVLTSEQIIGDF